MTTERRMAATANRPSTKVLPTSQKREDCSRALAHLVLMKTQARLSKQQSKCWVSLLIELYPVEVINRACLMLGLSEDPFPDLSKLVAKCEAIEREQNAQPMRGDPKAGPSKHLIDRAGKAFGLDVG